MIFHENRLPADDFHEISCLICCCFLSGKNFNCRLLQNIDGALRVKPVIAIIFVLFAQWLKTKVKNNGLCRCKLLVTLYRCNQVPLYLISSCNKNIIIYHECEGRIEKSVPRIAVWLHEAYRVMTNGDPDGQIFLLNPHTNNGFLFAHHCFLFKNKIPEVLEYA